MKKIFKILLSLFAGIWIVFTLISLIEPYYLSELVDNIRFNFSWRRTSKEASGYEIIMDGYPHAFSLPLSETILDEPIAYQSGVRKYLFDLKDFDFQRSSLEIIPSSWSGSFSWYAYVPQFDSYVSPMDINYLGHIAYDVGLSGEQNCVALSYDGNYQLGGCIPLSIHKKYNHQYVKKLLMIFEASEDGVFTFKKRYFSY